MTSFPPRTILVFSDGDPAGMRALETGIEMARYHDAELGLVRVEAPKGFPRHAGRDAVLDEGCAQAEDRGVRFLRRSLIEHDSIAAILALAATERPDLIIVGNRHHSAGRQLLLGSTALELIRNVRLPILVVDRGSSLPEGGCFHNILAPTDFSDASRQTLGRLIDYASEVCASIDLLHVGDPDSTPPYFPRQWIEEYQQHAHRHFQEFLPILPEDLQLNPSVKIGMPHQVICEHARAHNNDLIALCSSGLGAVGRFLLGSVTERVLRVTDRPVLVMHEAGDDDDTC